MDSQIKYSSGIFYKQCVNATSAFRYDAVPFMVPEKHDKNMEYTF